MTLAGRFFGAPRDASTGTQFVAVLDEARWTRLRSSPARRPDLRSSTVANCKALGRLYLVPHLGARLLAEIDVEAIMDMKGVLQATDGARASGKEGSRKSLSSRSVAKILTPGGTVWAKAGVSSSAMATALQA